MSISTGDLEKFVVECQPKLDTIKSNLNAFNIFNVLGVQHREIRHSNFLGWLFDPNESHQLDDVFLKGLFKLIREAGILQSHEYVELLLKDVSRTQVFRESIHDIDILILNKEHGFVITIENKIYANYSKNQLSKYYKYVESTYGEFEKRIYLTLTPNQSDSHKAFDAGENYTNINYHDIIQLLETNQKLVDKAFSTVKESINQYIAMVQKDITKTSKEVALAKEIYKNYKKEIDFIISNQDNFAYYKNEIIGFISDGNIEGFGLSHDSENKNVIFLLPTDEKLRSLFRYPEAKSRGGEYIFSLVLHLDKDAVWLKFGFGNIEESVKKEEIQLVKDKLFNAMKAFDCFKTSKINANFHKCTSDMEFASICGIPLFHNEMYSEENPTVLSLFKSSMEDVNREIIQPWVAECIEKLSSLPPNLNNSNESI